MVSAVATRRFLQGGGEMGALMRSMDWSATALGPVEGWPQSLRTSVSTCLNSRFPILIWWGPDLVKLYNDAYRPILGAKHPRSMGQAGRECWPEIWPIIGPMLQGVLERGEATWSENQLLLLERHGFAEECYFTFSYSPIRDESGGVAGVFCAVTETTGQVLAERRLRTLRDLAACAAAAKGEDETWRSFAAPLQLDPEDLPFALLYRTSRDSRTAQLACAVGVEAGRPGAPEVVDIAAGLPERWGGGEPGASLVAPIARPGSDAYGFLVVGLSARRPLDGDYRDLLTLIADHVAAGVANARAWDDEQQRMAALAEIDRAKTAFFGNVSHEFRTPLTLMLAPLEDVLREGPLDAAGRRRLELVHRNGVRLLKLVNSLLDFSRIEAGRMQAVYEPTDLAVLTADLASVFRAAIERAGLTLRVDCPTLHVPVHVDREMWEKIVLNLLSNAFKFTFEGEIAVALRRAGERVELTVRDTGIGIAAEELPHVFERFHRVRGARGRTHEGTGIGLALVQELVRLHGGTIGVTSEVDRGTAFTVAIPLGSTHLPAERIGAPRTLAPTATGTAPYVEEAVRWLPDDVVPEASPPSSAPLSTRGARVLLADDNADMREYLQALLAQHWVVDTVADGEAALAAARVQRPDLVLADVMMPRLDGLGLLRALRARPATENVPVILLSARAGEESRIEGLESGADDYLVKPFSARELIARVHAHLELHRVRAEAMAREQAARAQAEEANRVKDEFLATLSHELRTPLNAILGWAVLLRQGHPDADTLGQALQVIERNARAQSQLIEDLLDISRIISGKLRLDVRPIDLFTVIRAGIDAVSPAAMSKEIRLQPVLDPTAGPIAGDPERLQQVMWNLLSNAVKFTPRGGRVQVRLARVRSHVEIAVSDTGCGIAPEMLPYVFDRFRQADSSATRRHGGLGLGLALVKHLVELHGGTVRADSPGVDRGATFVVTLPLMARLPPDAGARRHPTARGSTPAAAGRVDGLRVLLVDDDAEALALFAQLFRQHGAEVTVARDAAEAMERLAAEHPDVLVCDVEMPGEDGYAFIRRVRSRAASEGGSVPAVAVTAYGSVEDRIRLLAAGFQMHLPKPVEPAELVTVVASVAGRTRPAA